jgi:hypothetical protein
LDLAGTGRNAVAWNGRSWRALGTLSPLPLALSVVDHRLIAGGLGFPGLETVFAWNGSEWLPLAGGPTIHAQTPLIPQIHALTEFDDELFAGGGFTHVGEDPSAFVARAVCIERGGGPPPPAPQDRCWLKRISEDRIQILDDAGSILGERAYLRPGSGRPKTVAKGSRPDRTRRDAGEVVTGYGSISATGAINGGTGKLTVTRAVTGEYDITISGETCGNSSFAVSVTPPHSTIPVCGTAPDRRILSRSAFGAQFGDQAHGALRGCAGSCAMRSEKR